MGTLRFVLLTRLLPASMSEAADVTRPSEGTGLVASRGGGSVHLSWRPGRTDATGHPEAVDHYAVYRGTSPDFVPDSSGGSHRIGVAPLPGLDDPTAALDAA